MKSEISQMEKGKYFMGSLICRIWKKKKIILLETVADSRMLVARGLGVGGNEE